MKEVDPKPGVQLGTQRVLAWPPRVRSTPRMYLSRQSHVAYRLRLARSKRGMDCHSPVAPLILFGAAASCELLEAILLHDLPRSRLVLSSATRNQRTSLGRCQVDANGEIPQRLSSRSACAEQPGVREKRGDAHTRTHVEQKRKKQVLGVSLRCGDCSGLSWCWFSVQRSVQSRQACPELRNRESRPAQSPLSAPGAGLLVARSSAQSLQMKSGLYGARVALRPSLRVRSTAEQTKLLNRGTETQSS